MASLLRVGALLSLLEGTQTGPWAKALVLVSQHAAAFPRHDSFDRLRQTAGHFSFASSYV